MDLFDVVRACFRRWYVFLPLVAIVAMYSHSVYNAVTPVYYSNAVIGLAPPSARVEYVEAGVPMSRNGLLDAGGAPLLANLTVFALREPAVVERVAAQGGLGYYGAKIFQVSQTLELPLIMIEITAADPALVTKTLNLVLAEADGATRSMQQQARVPNDQMVFPFVASPPIPPMAAMPSRLQSTVSIAVAGAGLTILLSVLIDVILTRRRSRAQKQNAVLTEAAAGLGSTDRSDDAVKGDHAVPAEGAG